MQYQNRHFDELQVNIELTFPETYYCSILDYIQLTCHYLDFHSEDTLQRRSDSNAA